MGSRRAQAMRSRRGPICRLARIFGVQRGCVAAWGAATDSTSQIMPCLEHRSPQTVEKVPEALLAYDTNSRWHRRLRAPEPERVLLVHELIVLNGPVKDDFGGARLTLLLATHEERYQFGSTAHDIGVEGLLEEPVGGIGELIE